MPLPAHMLANPASPFDALCSRVRRQGVSAEINRKGSTITIRNLEHPESDHDTIRRALRIINQFADTNRLTIEAVVPVILGNCISDLEATGFHIVHHIDEDAEDGAHTLLRRAPRQ